MPIYIQRNGEELGPYAEMQAQQLFQDGLLLPEDLAWRTGDANWGPLSALLMPITIPSPRVPAAVPPSRPWWQDLKRFWTKRR